MIIIKSTGPDIKPIFSFLRLPYLKSNDFQSSYRDPTNLVHVTILIHFLKNTSKSRACLGYNNNDHRSMIGDCLIMAAYGI